MVRAILALKASLVDTSNRSAEDHLIRYLRASAHTALSEILQFPESLSEGMLLEDGENGLPLPMLVILARAPHAIESAVNDAQQVLPIDFVYVKERAGDGATDDAQAIRDRLEVLQTRLRLDHRQGGNCNDTNLAATPIEVINEYQQFFAEMGQPVAAMILTMEFSLITGRL